ncbi:MAG: DUF1189 domain-containing protein [Lachnospiraceae bacterium]|nr:DUF1189 domain-containing protein [Lachnospiraceae bacterium]
METESKNTTGFFDQIIYSVKPKRYQDLLNLPRKKVVIFVLVLSLCLCIMDYVIPAAGWFASFGGMDHLITKVLPDIEFSKGELHTDGVIEIGKNSTTHLLVDTSKERVNTEELDTENCMMEILVSKKNMVIYNAYVGAMEVDFAQYQNSTFDNNSLLQLKPLIYTSMIFSFIMLVFMEPLKYLVSAIPLALIGSIRMPGKKEKRLTFGKIYLLALYAQTVPTLAQSFNRSANLISSQLLIVYLALFFAVFLLSRGVRYIEEDVK